MSTQNKVNPTQYHVGGRLTTDDAARERVKQRNVSAHAGGPADAPQSEIPVRAEGARDKGAAGVASMMPAKPKAKAPAAGRSRG